MRRKLRAGNWYRKLACLAVALSMAGLAFYTQETIAAARESVALCFDVIIPSLFPFFVLSTLAVEFGLAGYAGIALERVMRGLFGVSGACAPAFALGLIGGYPVGAKTAIAVYQKGLCTKTEAERLLAFCNNSGPAFILGAVGAGIFQSGMAGMLLYLTHIAASVTVGVIFRFYKRKELVSAKRLKVSFTFSSLTGAFVNAIRDGFFAVLGVCGFVVFFAVAIRMLYLFGVIPLLARALHALLLPCGVTAADAERLLSGLIEVTSGLWSLKAASGTMAARLAMAAFMLGWAGVSIHCQVLSFLVDSGLSTKTYFLGKLLHAFSSAVYAYLVGRLLPFSEGAALSLAEGITAVTSLDFSSSLYLALCTSVFLWALFLLPSLVLSVKKHWKRKLK